MAHADELYAIVADWMKVRTKFEAMEHLAAAGVPCSAVEDTAELHTDPHLLARGFVHNLDLPLHGEVPLLGFAPRMSGSNVPLTAPPLLGEHTEGVLRSDLDVSDERLAELRDAGAFGTDP